MHETSRLAGLLQERIDDRLGEHRDLLRPLGPDVPPLLDAADAFLTGGKRFRAQFAFWGHEAASPAPTSLDPAPGAVGVSPELDRALELGAALEFFHAAALVHDDIIDNSDTRRGQPAVHRHFEGEHREGGWRGSAGHFGVAAAILLGDLLQSWSDEAFQRAGEGAASPAAARRARGHFNRMRSEVAAGQYLDVLEEQLGMFAPDAEQLDRSTRVLVYKSAKYSVEAPLLIGAALAGASQEQEQLLSDFGLPIGVAFQLRDDVLGVFGDAAVTGKPSGDDLREGKRTVLVALTRQRLNASTKRLFDELLGDPELDAEQIVMMQRTIRESGALETVEQMIAQNVALAERALAGPGLSAESLGALRRLAARATSRNA